MVELSELVELATGPTASSIAKAVFVLAAALAVGFMARRLMDRWLAGVMPAYMAYPLAKAIYYGIIFLGIIAALDQVGVQVSTILVAGGVLGIVVGFAGQTVISNFLSGVFLYFDRPFSIGDPVQIGDVGGVVYDVSVFSTKVRTWDGVVVRIPNEEVFKSVIRGFTRAPVRRVEYSVSIAYKDDIGRAVDAIKRVLEESELILADPGPTIFVEELGDSGVILRVRGWAPSSRWFDAKTRLLRDIKEALEAAGVEIPFPQRTIWFADLQR